MARIRIEDLPPDTDLTPEELEQIYGGAGRRSFRPALEGLESRQLMDAKVGATLTAGVLHIEGTSGRDVVALRRVENQIEVLSGPKKELVNRFDAGQVKSIDMTTNGGQDRLDLTGLGKLGADARIVTGDRFGRRDKGELDVLFYDHAGRRTHVDYIGQQVREWYEGKIYYTEIINAIGDKTLIKGRLLESGFGQQLARTTLKADGTYIEETWSDDGKLYTKNRWKKEAHGAEGSQDHLSKTIIDKNNRTITVWKYHVSANVWWDGREHGVNDATQVWKYSTSENGLINSNDLLQYSVHMPNGTSNSWQKGGGWRESRKGDPPTPSDVRVTHENPF